MQTMNSHAVANPEPSRIEPEKPARPEPFITERVAASPVTATPGTVAARRSETGARFALAEAFMSLGRALKAKAAYQRAKDFYRSSGHHWTRGLR